MLKCIGLVLPLVEKHQFPTSGHYSRTMWALLLFEVLYNAIYGTEFMPPLVELNCVFWSSQVVEVQFAYYGTYGQMKDLTEKFPIVAAALVWLPNHHTKKQAKDIIKRQLYKPLKAFLSQIRPLGSMFIVRLLINPGQKLELVALCREITFAKGSHTSSIAREVVEGLIRTLEQVVDFAEAHGRPPKAGEVAHWWALKIFERLTIAEIAEQVSGHSPDSPDMEDKIAKALQRLGMKAT